MTRWVGTVTSAHLQSLTVACGTVTLSRVGGSGGAAFPATTWSTGFRSIRVNASQYIHAIAVVNVDGQISVSRGVGGGTQFSIACASDARVVGIHGTVRDAVIESLGLVCEKCE